MLDLKTNVLIQIGPPRIVMEMRNTDWGHRPTNYCYSSSFRTERQVRPSDVVKCCTCDVVMM